MRGFRAQVVHLEVFAQHLEGALGRVHLFHQLEVVLVDGAPLDQRLQVQDLVPVVRAVQDDLELLRELLRLHEGQDLEYLVERAEAAGKHHERLGQVREPELPHEEVVELEVQAYR